MNQFVKVKSDYEENPDNNFIITLNIAQGWRNVFTTGPAKLDHEDYAIKCMGGWQLL